MIRKNIVKRVAAFLAAAVMALSLCGCELFARKTAYEIYSEAVNTMNEAGGFEADCKISVAMSVTSVDMSIDFNMNMQMNGENAKIYIDYVDDTEMVTSLFDGYTYLEIGDEIKFKVKNEDDEFMADEGILPTLTEEMLEEVELVENEDGSTSFTVEISYEDAESLLNLTEEGMEVVPDSIVLSMTFDENDVIKSMKLEFDVTMEEEGVAYTGTESVECEFINVGTAPEIKLNYSEDEYIDLSGLSDDILNDIA